MTTTRAYTIDDLAQIEDDGFSYELIRGELIRMAPPGFEHGDVMVNAASILHEFVRRHQLGKVVGGDAGFVLHRGPDSVLGPDIAFISAERLPPPEQRVGWLEAAPDLVIEVRSPSDRPGDIARKVREYLDTGVRAVWILDPRRRTAAVHLAGVEPVTLRADETLDAGDVVPGFRVRVADLLGD